MDNREKLYLCLCSFFAIVLIIGNLICQKFVALDFLPFYTFEISAGTILYPLTYLITDLIAEFYDREKAHFCMQFSIMMNIFVVFIIVCMDALPATSWSPVDNATFHQIFGFSKLTFLGSMIACVISQRVDIFLYLWIKDKTKGKYLWLRNNLSTTLSLFLDTCISVIFMAAWGILPIKLISQVILNSYFFKFLFVLCNTPLFYLCFSLIRFFLRNNKDTSVKNLIGR